MHRARQLTPKSEQNSDGVIGEPPCNESLVSLGNSFNHAANTGSNYSAGLLAFSGGAFIAGNIAENPLIASFGAVVFTAGGIVGASSAILQTSGGLLQGVGSGNFSNVGNGIGNFITGRIFAGFANTTSETIAAGAASNLTNTLSNRGPSEVNC
ncbi:MAG: hypothetical protein AAFU58_06615 [Pseudomonadota bacterium]